MQKPFGYMLDLAPEKRGHHLVPSFKTYDVVGTKNMEAISSSYVLASFFKPKVPFEFHGRFSA